METLQAIIITAITTLGGASAFRFYEKRAQHKEEDDRFIRLDCQSRIVKLETLLQKSSDEKDELRLQIIKLVEEVSALRTEVKYLQSKTRQE
jgi:hypothetical protein